MDVLDDVFATIGLQGALYFRTDFSAPWSVTVPDLGRAARFHLVVSGHGHVAFASGARIPLGPGDVVLIPNGRSHVLADSPVARPAPPLEDVLEAAGYDGRGVLVIGDGDAQAATRMICGHLNFRAGAEHPILDALPEFIVATAARRASEPWLDELLRLMAERLFGGHAASAAVVTRLSEIVFIELLRIGARSSAQLAALLAALKDRHIGRALELIHAKPDTPWTVDRLARTIGMSRSRFAERFSDLIGCGPMAYLASWRLQRALALLDESRCSVRQVAFRTGYRSPAAFSRAFADKFGYSPREYRRRIA